MISHALLAALVVCGTSLTAAYTYTPLANGATCQPNYNLNWVSGNTAGAQIASNLQYPLCAYDNHHGPSSAGYVYLYGGYDGADEMNLYASTNGFKTLAFPPVSETAVGPHRMGVGAVTNNGTVILVGGETGTTAGTTDTYVYYSTNHGQTFTQAGIAPFQRYEGQMLSIPYTNKLVLIGGYDQTGAQTNDIWLSQDGIGAVWTKQNPNGSPIPTNALAGSVVLFDSKYVNPTLYSSPNSTILFFLEYSNGAYWMTYDLGRTWTQSWIYPFSTASSSVGHRDWLSATADLDNYIYFTGMYNVPDPSVWISMTKGQTWALLTQSMSIPGVSSTLMYYWSKYGCVAFGYNATTLSKQIYLYGYQQVMSNGAVYQSLIGDLNVPNGQPGYGVLPNATIASSAPVSQLPSVAWPACSYNIHSLTSNPSFYTFGGQVTGTTTGSTFSYRSTDGITFSQVSATALPSNLMNAGSVRLNNGNILVMGGQPTTAASGYSSVVYVSTDNGVTFTQSASSTFGTRTNMITCAAPGTNTVVVIGGYISGTTATNNIYISQDGRGATWQQIGTLPVVTAAGSCVFLYDSSSVSSSFASPNSTLLVFTHTGRLYRSYNLGASFDSHPSQVKPGPSGYQFLPFSTQFDSTSTRYQVRVVADYDNHLYATGGLNIYDNGVYFSGDLGFTWYRIKQINNLNSGNYIMGSTSCFGMSYTQSGSSYTKRLSLYGGLSVQFDNAAANYSAISFVLDDTPSFIPAVSGTAMSTSVMATQADNAQLWCSYNSSQASVQWTSVTPVSLVPQLQYPSCGKDVHHFADSSRTTSLFMYGGSNTDGPTSRLYATNDGFQTLLPATHSDTLIGTRRMGSMAVMQNGDILHLGGQTGTTVDSTGSDVYVSHNGGATFTLVNNTFPRRYETQVIQVPYTNTLVMVGGNNELGAEVGDIWISTDGQGAIWTLQASTSPVAANALAGAIALYDSVYCNPALYSSPNATLLFFLEYSLGDYWMSYDLGRTWTINYVYPFSTGLTSASQVTHRDWLLFAADLDNYIYHFGMYNNPDQTMWISRNKGQYWEAMQISPSTIPGTSAYTYVMWAEYGCGGMQYSTNPTTNQRQKQFAVWGYQNWLTDGTTYSAAVANLLNVPNVQGYPYAPNATLQTPLRTSAIPNGQLPACAYNVHARNGVMMAMGGQSIYNNVSSGHSIFTASTSSFATSSASNMVSIDVSSSVSPVSGAGLAFLENGNILYFGGQNLDGTYSNNVYLSSSTNGIGFTAVATAPWQGRSNFITCTMPNSNTVVVIGGQSSSSLADFWVSTDGRGATWTQRTSVPWSASLAVQAGTCVFLHDTSSAQPIPTLLVFLHTNVYYRSLDGGLTWLKQPDVRLAEAPAFHTAPWSAQFGSSKVRYGIEVVADFDNHLYALAGTDVWDNTMWWSGDKGFTWYRMKQINSVNSAYFIQASTSCLGINYRQGATAGNNWNKTLVLYGGNIQFDDRSNVGAMQIVLDNPVIVVPSDAAAFNLQPVSRPTSSSSSTAAQSSSAVVQPSSSSIPTSQSSSTSVSPSSSSIPAGASSSSAGQNPSDSSSAGQVPSDDSTSNSSSSLSGGAIAGIVIGSLVGALIICSIAFFLGACGGKYAKNKTSKDDMTGTYDHQRDESSVHHQTDDVEMA